MSDISDRTEDRSLAHPIEAARDVVELVNVLDRLAVALEREGQRQTRFEDLLRSLIVNDVFWSGAAKLDADYSWTYTAQAPFAAVTIDDVNSVGPLVVVAGGDLTGTESQGPGRWKVPVGDRRVFAVTSSTLSVRSTTPTAGIFYATIWGINRGIV